MEDFIPSAQQEQPLFPPSEAFRLNVVVFLKFQIRSRTLGREWVLCARPQALCPSQCHWIRRPWSPLSLSGILPSNSQSSSLSHGSCSSECGGYHTFFTYVFLTQTGATETGGAWALLSVALDREVSYSVLVVFVFLLEAHVCVWGSAKLVVLCTTCLLSIPKALGTSLLQMWLIQNDWASG